MNVMISSSVACMVSKVALLLAFLGFIISCVYNVGLKTLDKETDEKDVRFRNISTTLTVILFLLGCFAALYSYDLLDVVIRMIFTE